MQRVGEYLRFRNAIPQKLVELAILVTARHVDNAFEWVLHQPLARKEGVAQRHHRRDQRSAGAPHR